MEPTLRAQAKETLRALPGDDVRRVMWRFTDRHDLQVLVRAVRGVARGPVAKLVAQGGRHTHEWTVEKHALLAAFDRAGITTACLEPDAGGVGRVTAELVFGYGRHPEWAAEGCAGCYGVEDREALESIMPGIESAAGAFSDVLERDGSHRPEAGPCVRMVGLDDFLRLRRRMDGCLAGSRLAKDGAAVALTRVTIPEALDYEPAIVSTCR